LECRLSPFGYGMQVFLHSLDKFYSLLTGGRYRSGVVALVVDVTGMKHGLKEDYATAMLVNRAMTMWL
jgi:hypothetical protein